MYGAKFKYATRNGTPTPGNVSDLNGSPRNRRGRSLAKHSGRLNRTERLNGRGLDNISTAIFVGLSTRKRIYTGPLWESQNFDSTLCAINRPTRLLYAPTSCGAIKKIKPKLKKKIKKLDIRNNILVKTRSVILWRPVRVDTLKTHRDETIISKYG